MTNFRKKAINTSFVIFPCQWFLLYFAWLGNDNFNPIHIGGMANQKGECKADLSLKTWALRLDVIPSFDKRVTS